MKKLLYLLILFINFSFKTMDYTVLDFSSLNKLKNEKDSQFLMNIEFNFSSLYLLKDSSYLVSPLNPFGKGILVKDKFTLDKFINEKYFPVDEVETKFYFKNKSSIENLINVKDDLKQNLHDYISKVKGIVIPNDISMEDIDRVYNILKEKRKVQYYKLHFIVLVGDYLIQNNSTNNYCWGLLENKQLLNPIVNPILVIKKGDSLGYFNLEDKLFGKYGFMGIHNIRQSIQEFIRKPNEVEVIRKIFSDDPLQKITSHTKELSGQGAGIEYLELSAGLTSIILGYEFYKDADELRVEDQNGNELFATERISTHGERHVTIPVMNVSKLVFKIKSVSANSRWRLKIQY